MRKSLGLLIVIAFLFAACGNKTPPPDGQGVGMKRLNLTDADRPNWAGTADRPLKTTIWYPSAEGAEMHEIGIPLKRPVFIGGFAARNATLSENQQAYPLILMSHGTGGAAFQMMWLARSFAENGYIVAAVDHHGNTAAEEAFDPRGFRMPWERARDVSAVLDKLLEDPEWGPRIDSNKIGAVGFSLGGYAVTALVGGEIDFKQFEAFCNGGNRDATCDEQSEFPDAGKRFEGMLKSDPALAARMEEHRGSFEDTRIQAVVALAPALGQAFTGSSLNGIDIPYLVIAGSADNVAPLATNAEFLARKISGAQLKTIPDAGHYVFLNSCNKRGKRYVPVCKDLPGANRDQVHDTARKEALTVFENVFGK